MKEKEMKEPGLERRSLLRWVRELLGREGENLPEAPSEKTVGILIGKAAGESPEEEDKPEPAPEDSGTPEGASEEDTEDSSEDSEKKKGCPYALKRNIVESLRVIREFAEKNGLAAAMVRALLTLLAEMALEALKGKVGVKALETLLRGFNYSRDIDEAFRRGMNGNIRRTYFEEPDEIPHLGGMDKRENEEPDIFAIAKEA